MWLRSSLKFEQRIMQYTQRSLPHALNPWCLWQSLCKITYWSVKRFLSLYYTTGVRLLYTRGADMSLARPGRKQAAATKLGIYSTYSPRRSMHIVARCCNVCKTLKKKSEGCPSNQVSAAELTSASDEKWRTFNCFFQSREQVVVRRGQIRRVG